MDISVEPSEVKKFSRQLQKWSDNMASTQRAILSSARSLESKWKDPQYRLFVGIASTQAATLEAAIEQFETCSKELSEMATQLEEQIRRDQQRLRNMRRR